MEAFYAYVKATIYKLVGFTCIVTAVLFLGGWWQYISGWCIGSGLNIVYFFKLPPGQAASFIRGGAVFRLVFICLAVIVILQFPSISLGAAVAGIFSYRVLVFADVLTARLRR